VAIARAEEDLDREIKMYFTLLDLLRSPELVKKIGDEYLEFMIENREMNIKQQVWIVKRDMLIEEKKKNDELKAQKENEKN